MTATLPESHNAFVYVYEGEAIVGDGESERTPPRGELGVLSHGETLLLAADEGPTRLIFVAGKPLNEPVAKYGPFVMNTPEQIVAAIRDYQSGVSSEFYTAARWPPFCRFQFERAVRRAPLSTQPVSVSVSPSKRRKAFSAVRSRALGLAVRAHQFERAGRRVPAIRLTLTRARAVLLRIDDAERQGGFSTETRCRADVSACRRRCRDRRSAAGGIVVNQRLDTRRSDRAIVELDIVVRRVYRRDDRTAIAVVERHATTDRATVGPGRTGRQHRCGHKNTGVHYGSFSTRFWTRLA